MKHFFATLAFAVAFSGLHAQSLGVGARVGATSFLEYSGVGPARPFDYLQSSVTPEVFMRYRAKKHWAFEASLEASRLHREESVEAIDAPWHYAHGVINTNMYGLGLGAQYEVACHHRGREAAPRRFHYYIGISVHGVLAHEVENIYPVETPDKAVLTIVRNDWQLWGGITHTFSYDLDKRISLIGTFDTRLNLGRAFFNCYGNEAPAASAGLRLGAAFRLSGSRKQP